MSGSRCDPGDRDFEAVDLIDVMEEAVRYNAHLVRAVLRCCADAQPILDFGAGSGRAALALRRRGLAVHAVEPDARLRERIARRGIPVHPSLAALGEQRFGSAYALNVLEHLPDDRAVLAALHERLLPGGRLLLYVPAFQALYSANDRRVGHLRRYTRRQLTDRLRAAGFRVERARYVDSLGFLAALAYRLLGDREGGLDRRWVRAYDRLLFPVSRVLDAVLQIAVGKNLLVVATRPRDG